MRGLSLVSVSNKVTLYFQNFPTMHCVQLSGVTNKQKHSSENGRILTDGQMSKEHQGKTFRTQNLFKKIRGKSGRKIEKKDDFCTDCILTDC